MHWLLDGLECFPYWRLNPGLLGTELLSRPFHFDMGPCRVARAGLELGSSCPILPGDHWLDLCAWVMNKSSDITLHFEGFLLKFFSVLGVCFFKNVRLMSVFPRDILLLHQHKLRTVLPQVTSIHAIKNQPPFMLLSGFSIRLHWSVFLLLYQVHTTLSWLL